MTLSRRLIEFASRTMEQGSCGLSAIWSGLVSVYQSPLIAALRNEDENAVVALLSQPGELMWGIENGTPLDLDGEHGQRMIADLARRIGILPVFNPEQSSPSNNWQPVCHCKLRSRVEEIVGPLRVPSGYIFYGDPPGFPSQQMFRIAEWFTVTSFLGGIPKRILDIGGGTGGWAIMAWEHGCQSYTSIDIPSTSVMSAFFVARGIGEEKIHLSGEEHNPSAFGHWYSCNDSVQVTGEYDLIVNCNSLPEMPCEYQDRYMDLIYRSLSSGGIFYSCNHESDLSGQWRVLSAIERHGGFKMCYRAPFIPRPGYVEEIYRRK